ncbi:MAG: M23 family metallopeptidase [Thermodesulfobacteriota bacterium]
MQLDSMEKQEKRGGSKLAGVLLGLAALVVVGLAAAFFILCEMEAPKIVMKGDIAKIGAAKQMAIEVTDGKSGLRSITVEVVQGDKKATVLTKEFPRQATVSGAGPAKAEEAFEVAAKELGLKEGEAQLIVTVADFSYWNLGRGNVVANAWPVSIDFRPPALSVVESPQYIKAGGAGVVVYRIGEKVERHGVMINDTFYAGFPLPKRGEGVYGATIGLPFNTEKLDKSFVVATDLAGNQAKSPFGMLLHKRVIPTDQITISDGFLEAKLPEFATHYPELSGTPVEQYLKVNNDIRKANNAKIQEVASVITPERLWDGRFDRMEGSPRARYADHRSYLYNGEKIDEQVHLGVDIAALQHFEVRAANRGTVVFADYLGIYGNTVILDHGQGIFSLYSHLSQISAAPGALLDKGVVLGLSGTTGMAGGDHLHFSMLVNGVFVDPVEWWDPEWLKLHMLSVL